MLRKRKSFLKPPAEDPILSQIRDCYEFMRQSGLETLEFAQDDMHLRLVRKGHGPGLTVAPQSPIPGPQSPNYPANTQSIKSPMAGIFYRASSPSSPPYIKEGQAVRPGQVICLVEAMKVFNEIKADQSCRILKALVENGKPVKSGQEIFLAEPIVGRDK